jgi:hypothetical protein
VQPFDTRADEPGTVLFCVRRLLVRTPSAPSLGPCTHASLSLSQGQMVY